MADYIILTDSACDMDANMAKDLGLKVAPLNFMADGVEYRGYLDEREISFKETYDKIRNGAKVSTSAVNVACDIEYMEEALKVGKDVLVLSFSSGLSTTYNSAEIAADDMREKYPDRKIYVVDTLCASGGQGLLVYLAAKQK